MVLEVIHMSWWVIWLRVSFSSHLLTSILTSPSPSHFSLHVYVNIICMAYRSRTHARLGISHQRRHRPKTKNALWNPSRMLGRMYTTGQRRWRWKKSVYSGRNYLESSGFCTCSLCRGFRCPVATFFQWVYIYYILRIGHWSLDSV
jgi:hypothetical protein